MAKLDIIGPIFPYTENDARLIAQKMNEFKPDEQLDVFFHSPGGSVWEAKAIFNMFLQHPGPVVGHVVLAMSAASFAAMGCDELVVSEFSEFMIHRAMDVKLFMGNAVEIDPFIDMLKKQKEALENEDKAIAAIYAKRGGLETKQVLDWMAQTTTWRGKEILKAGFATKFESIPARDKSNFMNFDLSCYKNGADSPWHQPFDAAIPPQESWALSASQYAEETPHITAATPDPDKLRQIAINRAKARDRLLALQHRIAT